MLLTKNNLYLISTFVLVYINIVLHIQNNTLVSEQAEVDGDVAVYLSVGYIGM
jgi:hypothetical protein